MISVVLLAATMMDSSLPVSQRNDACVALRGEKSVEIVAVMRKGLSDAKVRSCAGNNLRLAGAKRELQDALNDEIPEVRALAARQLGDFNDPELIAPLAAAAADPLALVATNAVDSLAAMGASLELKKIALRGGIAGTQALDRLTEKADPAAAEVARTWLAGSDPANVLVAVRVLGETGNGEDLAALRKIEAANREELSSKGRGFGFMPAFSLARAARTATDRIEARLVTAR